MTIRDATRLLTERGCRVGWFDRRPGIAKDLRYSVGAIYRTVRVFAIDATVQAAYDRMLEHIAEIDRNA